MNDGDLSYQAVLAMIGVSRGKQDVIAVPLVFVDWLGTYEVAAMLTQVLYWCDVARSQGQSYFTHSVSEWQSELHLPERRIAYCVKMLRGVGLQDTAKGYYDGSPVYAYTLDSTRFVLRFHRFMLGVKVPIADTLGTDTAPAKNGLQPHAHTRAVNNIYLDPDDQAKDVTNPKQKDSAKARALAETLNLDHVTLNHSDPFALDPDSPFLQESTGEDIYNSARARAGNNLGAILPDDGRPLRMARKPSIDLSRPMSTTDPSIGAQEGAQEPTEAYIDPALDPGPYGDHLKTRKPMPVPPNYDPGPKLRRWWETQADREGINLQLQVGAFVDYWNEKQRTTTDVDAMFRNWMRNKIRFKQTDHSIGSGKKRGNGAPVSKGSYEHYVTPPQRVRIEPVDIYNGPDARKMRAGDVPRDDVEMLAEMRDAEPAEDRIKYAIREAGLILRDKDHLVSMNERALAIWQKRDEPVETFVGRLKAASRIARNLEEVLAYVEVGAV